MWGEETSSTYETVKHYTRQALGTSAAVNPYSTEFAIDRLKLKSSSTDALSDGVSTATATSEYEAKLKVLQDVCKQKDAEIATLHQQLENAKALDAEIASLHEQLERAKAQIPQEVIDVDGSEPVNAGSAESAAAAPVSQAAAKQRLRRLCERKADGTLQVPEDIHTAWKEGGASRDRLLKVYVRSGMCKDSFLRQIQLQTSKSKEMKVSVTGDFFTEEEMKDTLNLSRLLVESQS